MRIAFATLALLTLGCAESPPATHGPRLRHVATGLDERHWPAIFALKLANDGDEPATIDNVVFQVTDRTLLYDDAGDAPPSEFECVVAVFGDDGQTSRAAGDVLTIRPGETVDVSGAIQWAVKPNSAPMLAIVRAALIPQRRGESLVEPEPLIMFLQSGPGALEAVRQSSTTDAERAIHVADGLRAIEGKRSPDFEDLIRSIEAIAYKEM